MHKLYLIQNANVFQPDPLGQQDVLVGGGRILAMGDDLSVHGTLPLLEVVDARGCMMFPGLIDQHVHMAGGGGEGGFQFRTPEISLSHLTTAGVTTAVGVLGTDGVTRTTRELLAKALALEFEGITTYLYCGAYQVPTRTITGTPRGDIVLIEKILGVGEIAIADSRSSHPTGQELIELASEARVGGLLSGKAGVVHLHVGDDDDGLRQLFDIIQTSRLPTSMFTPTHLNRNPDLLAEAVRYGTLGGIVDVTSGIRPDVHDDISVKPARAIRYLMDAGVSPQHITMSSDSNGSSPIFTEAGELVAMGIGSVATLWEETRDLIVEEQVPIDVAVSIVTRNVARVLKLADKGRIRAGAAADLLLTDEAYRIQHVFAKGEWLVKDGKPLVVGTFEGSADIPGSPGVQSTSGGIDDRRGRPLVQSERHAADGVADGVAANEGPCNTTGKHKRHYCC